MNNLQFVAVCLKRLGEKKKKILINYSKFYLFRASNAATMLPYRICKVLRKNVYYAVAF